MDIEQQCITEYLTKGTWYRKLAAKYVERKVVKGLSVNKLERLNAFKN